MHPGQKLKPGARVVFEGAVDAARRGPRAAIPRPAHRPAVDRGRIRRSTTRSTRSGTCRCRPTSSATIGPTDRERYQTVFARRRGSIAAPTAGCTSRRRSSAPGRARRRAGRDHAARRLRHVPTGRASSASRSTAWSAERFDVAEAAAAAAIERGARRRPARHRRGHDATRALEAVARAHGGGLVAAVGGTTSVHLPGVRVSASSAGCSPTSTCRESSLLMLVCGLRRPRARAARGTARRRARLPLLQLRRRDADPVDGERWNSRMADAGIRPVDAVLLRRVRSLRHRTYPLAVPHEQGARRRFRAAVPRADAASSALLDVAAEHPRRRPTSRPSSQAIVDARGATAGIVWGLGAHVIKTGLGAVLIDLMERGFVSAIATNGAGDHSRLRDRARRAPRPRTSTRRSVRAVSAWPRKPARLLNGAIDDGVGRGPGHRAGGRRVPRWRSTAVRAAAASLAAGGAARHSGDRARRDRHRHHPHASRRRRARRSARAACATSGTSCRRTSRASSGGVYLNCGSAVVLPEVFLKAVALARNRGDRARRPDDRQSRLRAAVPARRPTSSRARRPAPAAAIR